VAATGNSVTVRRKMCHMMTLRLIALGTLLASGIVHAAPFALDTAGRLPTIVTDGATTTRLAGDLLRRDLQQLTGLSTTPATALAGCLQRCIVIGTADSALVRQAARAMQVDLAPLAGQTERYIRVAGQVDGRSVLLVAGADRRGAVYGVVDASRELGVSAWEWWADVTLPRRTNLVLDGAYRIKRAFGGVARHLPQRRGLGPATVGRQNVRSGR
jgi:hypothetical protein